MSQDLSQNPSYRSTIERLEAVKRITTEGTDFWTARDIHAILGYPTWREFEAVIKRAEAAFVNNGVDPSHQIVLTHKLMIVGNGAQIKGEDYFLGRPACHLIAMNGDPIKPEIAAAQAYFIVQTRRMELEDAKSDDEKRIELREKVTKSVKLVSGVAQNAGVRSKMQGVFHDKRYQGLYGVGLRDLRSLKGLSEKDNLLDRAGLLELSMHEFQMNLAADVIGKSNSKSESAAIQTNLQVAKKVRDTVLNSGGTKPENLSLEPPIKEIKKKLATQKKLPKA
jgi:DNA-damage-inducible protein D